MNTPSEYIAWPDTIEYGGLIWHFEKRKEGAQYRAFKDGDIEMRVYQYPDGPWLWNASFQRLVTKETLASGVNTDASSIINTREEAMFACINAFGGWLDGMQHILLELRGIDQYAQGYRAGQEDIKAKVAEVVL